MGLTILSYKIVALDHFTEPVSRFRLMLAGVHLRLALFNIQNGIAPKLLPWSNS